MISTDQAEQTEDYPSGQHVLQLERGVAPLLLVVLGRKESTGINEDNEEDEEGDDKEFTYQGTEMFIGQNRWTKIMGILLRDRPAKIKTVISWNLILFSPIYSIVFPVLNSSSRSQGYPPESDIINISKLSLSSRLVSSSGGPTLSLSTDSTQLRSADTSTNTAAGLPYLT